MKTFVKGLGHIGIQCEDAQTAVNFYTQKLHFEHFYSYDLQTDNGLVKLRLVRAGDCIIEFVEPEDKAAVRQRRSGIIDHVAIEVQGLDALVEELREAGVDTFQSGSVTCLPNFFPNGSRMIFLTGPCSETIVLFEYTRG